MGDKEPQITDDMMFRYVLYHYHGEKNSTCLLYTSDAADE